MLSIPHMVLKLWRVHVFSILLEANTVLEQTNQLYLKLGDAPVQLQVIFTDGFSCQRISGCGIKYHEPCLSSGAWPCSDRTAFGSIFLCLHSKISKTFSKMLSETVALLLKLYPTPGTVAHQAPLSMWQGHWSWLPFSLSWNLPNPGIKSTSLTSPALAGRLFTTGTTWEALEIVDTIGLKRWLFIVFPFPSVD